MVAEFVSFHRGFAYGMTEYRLSIFGPENRCRIVTNESHVMLRNQPTFPSWRMIALAIGIPALAFLITGLIKLNAPWTIATADVVLQDDTLFEEASTLYPSLNPGSDTLNSNVGWLRSKDAAQSMLEQLPPRRIRMLVESGNTWVVRTKERLRGWGCADHISRWSYKDKDLCSWLGGHAGSKATAEQREIIGERLSIKKSEEGRLVSISFRSADRDLSVAIVTAFGNLLVAERDEAKQALRRKVKHWIETARAAIPQRPAEAIEEPGGNDDDVRASHAEIRLFRKVVAAMVSANDDLSRLGKSERDDASQIPVEDQIAKAEQDRMALNQELARVTAAFKKREWKGFRELLPNARTEEEALQSADDARVALTSSDYSFLVHPDWARPATVLRQPVTATGLSTLMAFIIALPLAILISLVLVLSRAVVQNRTKQHLDMGASLYANPHWPSIRPPRQSDLTSTV